MITRKVLRNSTARRVQVCMRAKKAPTKTRQYSTSTSSPSAPSPASNATSVSSLSAFTNELDKIAPRFEIHGSQIRVLRSPAEFYETLKAKILAAEERIFLSTLYIGKTEDELITTLQQALRKNRKLKLSILVDALRGSRESPDPSCASLLTPLVVEFGEERVDLRMWHTPNLTGLRRDYIPKRINEGWGLQHMKLYGVDDEIIISGANLSNDYFTNRQDRYHLFSSKAITDYFYSVHSTVSQLSYTIMPVPYHENGYVLAWPETNLAPGPIFEPKAYMKKTSTILSQLIKAKSTSSSSSTNLSEQPKPNTVVYPISQLTPLLHPDTSTELPAITHILETLSSPNYSNSSWTFTAGYFNPDPSLTKLLLSASSKNNTVITAHPHANGFFSSKGVSGLLPGAYTLLSRRFLESAAKAGREQDVTLREWKKGVVNEPGGWTYHAKGLWIALNGEKEPSITVVGSSNYTKRSYKLDLEVGSLILTTDEGLKKQLREERDGLGGENTAVVTKDDFARSERRVGIKVRVAMWIVSLVGGAL